MIKAKLVRLSLFYGDYDQESLVLLGTYYVSLKELCRHCNKALVFFSANFMTELYDFSKLRNSPQYFQTCEPSV